MPAGFAKFAAMEPYLERVQCRVAEIDRAEQLARGLLDLVLVLGEVEVHAAAPFRRGRPSTRSATMFLRISVVPPSIVLPRERSSS